MEVLKNSNWGVVFLAPGECGTPWRGLLTLLTKDPQQYCRVYIERGAKTPNTHFLTFTYRKECPTGALEYETVVLLCF